MKQIAPSYYPVFRCIADRCRHSCCIGWEIDIDSDTAAFYRSLDGAFGQRLHKHIATEGDVTVFRLGENERCPFLNTNGLCDIICTLGEESLCQICADHPRFRNVFSDREEIGLGLCCEEAARIILTSDSFSLIPLSDDGCFEPLYEDEASLLAERDKLFAIAQDHAMSIAQREQAILQAVGCAPLSAAALYDRLVPLERLEEDWDDILAHLPDAPDCEPPEALRTAFEQLLCYFLYRHLPDALDDGRYSQRAAFAAHSVKVLRLLCAAHGKDRNTLLDLTRRYSSEIEYSDENMDALLESF